MSNEPEIKSPEASPTTRLKEIAGFEILGKLGQGGMGAVFKARQKSLDRIVALKVLPPKIAKDAKFIERFQREARASAKLNHPNIVQGIDVGNDPATGLWYFAMEYVDGPSLKKVLEEQKVIPEERALALVRDVAKALETIGTHHMVHRDIKPDNILITTRGETKLADMGLAKQMDEDASLTQSGQAVGTPHYMSPEQVRGKFEECDIRTDIYSLGATLFHLVTGKPPFTGATSALIMSMHLTEAPPKAIKANPAVSEGCSRLIEKMMQKKIEQRVQTPADLIQQIDKILSGELGESVTRGVHKTTGPRAPVTERRRDSDSAKGNNNLIYAGIAAVALVVVLVFAMKGGGKPASVVDANPKTDSGSGSTTHTDTKTPPVKTNNGGNVAAKTPPKTPSASPEELYKAAQDFEQKNPDSIDETAQRYQRVAVAAKGTPQEAEFQDKVDDAIAALKTKQRTAADNAFKAAEGKATEFATAGNYDDALNAYQAIPAKLAALVKDKTEEKMRLLHQEAEEKISTVTKKAEAFATDAEPAEGLKALAEVENVAYSPMRGIVVALKKKLTDDLANEADLKKKKNDLAALKRLIESLKKFDNALLETRDLKAAATIATEAKNDPVIFVVEATGRVALSMTHVMAAYDEIAKIEQEALQKQIGQKVELETATGVMKGSVAKIQDGIITLRIDFGGGASGEKKVKVAELSEAQRKKLFPPFVPLTDPQRIAQCYTLLSKANFDFTGALEQLVLAPDFPLTPYVRNLANNIRAEKELAKAEAAAPAAWAEIYMKGNQANISEADGKVISERIAKFEAEFGKTQFAASVKDKLTAIKAKLSSAASPNLVLNGDFEKGTIDGWDMKGGTRVAEISSVQFHVGKHSVQCSVPPDYYVSLSQHITVEPEAEYKLSCWVKLLSGTLEMANRSGVYIIEGDSDRRDPEIPSIQVMTTARLGEWVRMETKYTAKSNSVKLDVFLRQRQKGTEKYVLLVDDIELSKISKDSAKLAPAPVPDLFKALGLVFWVTPNGDPAGTSRELLTNTNATDKGAVTIVSDSGLKSMKFEDSYVSYPAAANVKSIGTSGSAFIWIKMDKLPAGWSGLLSRCDTVQGDRGHNDFAIYMNRDKFLLSMNWPENPGWPAEGKNGFFSKRPLPTGKWLMIGATWDGKVVTLWVNGEKDNSYNSTTTPLVRAFPEVIALGCEPAGQPEYFNGLMMGAMIYNRALTELEIKSLYAMSGIIGK
jgi:serine/threonine protein kinase